MKRFIIWTCLWFSSSAFADLIDNLEILKDPEAQKKQEEIKPPPEAAKKEEPVIQAAPEA
jgi:hypothetical protein